MYPASFGVTRRGSASKGKGVAAACAVERDSDQAQMLRRPKENSKQKRETRTAPHCDRGSLRMANQVATGAGNAFAYGTGAGSRSHMGAG